MKSSIENVRELAGRNATLLRGATDSNGRIHAAAEAECARLSKLIDGAKHADLLTDDSKAELYQAWVTDRAKLQRLLEGTHD